MKNRNKVIFIVILISVVSLLWLVKFKEEVKIKAGTKVFKAELAVTDSERARGLSGRKGMCEECAMLFIFNEPGYYSFHMQGMLFPLDMLWLRGEELVHVEHDVPVSNIQSLRPLHAADKVLEINAGIANSLGLKVGDRVQILP